jgi:AGCS family alanine or glycine:cation symporter
MSKILPLVIVGEGAWLLFKLRAFYVLHPKRTLRAAFSGEGCRDAWLSLMLALAGTLGVGNILGVTVAIGIGGAGSLFWMITASLFSAIIKYAEVRITAAHGSKTGMIGVLKRSFKLIGSPLSAVYAAAAFLLSLSMGAALQSAAVGESATATFGAVPPLFAALFVASVIPLVCLGDGIKKAVAIIIPMATISYTGMCLFVILPNFACLPSVITECIKDAFSGDGALGGALGFLTSSALTKGFSAGLLSNEAGAGTSSFSHNALPQSEAARAGVFGIIEVFFDTVFLCTLTGLTLLIGIRAYPCEDFGITALSRIFSRYTGRVGEPLLFASITAFALSTVICWYYYGSVSVRSLVGEGKKKFVSFLFAPLFLFAVTVGMLFDIPWLIPLTDALLLILTLLTLAAIVKNRGLLSNDFSQK